MSPFACLPARVPVRKAPKALLIELSKQLERQAMRLGETCVVASTFQEARHVTPATRLRYPDLVERVGFVAALGEDLPVEPMPGLRGADLAPGDPVRGEWDVVVLSPHFSAELLGRNCRFLQDTDTDPGAVGRMRAAIAAGAECREVLHNRRADGSTWWNECTLIPVTDETGAVVQYIGIQADDTEQVQTERALLTERDRVRRYAARIAELDPRVPVPSSPAPPADGPQAATDSPGARRA